MWEESHLRGELNDLGTLFGGRSSICRTGTGHNDFRHHYVGTRRSHRQRDDYGQEPDTDSGKAVAVFDAGGGADEMFFDAASQRIYLQGYEGIADVWKEVDPDHYESIGRIQGGVHGKTSLLVPELRRYYVAVSEHQDVIRGIQGGKVEEAYIEVYEVQP